MKGKDLEKPCIKLKWSWAVCEWSVKFKRKSKFKKELHGIHYSLFNRNDYAVLILNYSKIDHGNRLNIYSERQYPGWACGQKMTTSKDTRYRYFLYFLINKGFKRLFGLEKQESLLVILCTNVLIKTIWYS